ncbi:hypothetical protein AAFF_G00033510 [Aldrovandia affinis]|uniref:Ig-like domain-containing protein n=1 Tax=Aldrovandia affinis TaxID=143900 RepID=A0AAD7WFN1_9TELE|nr:hypothetical protein AAFF_G00033510 [Aldrovandia affinis]
MSAMRPGEDHRTLNSSGLTYRQAHLRLMSNELSYTTKGRQLKMCGFIKAICLTVLILFAQKTGGTVTLTCVVEGSDLFTQWKYSWKKLRGTEETPLFTYTGEVSSVYTLNRVAEFDSAQYWCEAKSGTRSIMSSPHTLTVTCKTR